MKRVIFIIFFIFSSVALLQAQKIQLRYSDSGTKNITGHFIKGTGTLIMENLVRQLKGTLQNHDFN